MSVRIRPFRHGDEPDLKYHADNPRVAASLRDAFPQPYTLEDAREWVKLCRKQESLARAIVLNDKVIGAVGAVRDSDVHQYNAEVGYWLGESHWGKGYATSALAQLVEWLFAETTLTRLYAGVFGFNAPSMRVLSKAGFHLEAIHRQSVYKNGRFWDEHYYVRARPPA